ncbi:MAG: hypothetical protein PVH61_10675 [Candidatus Aminicenantes bacterium]|jgi:hypothetical protein
MPCQWTAPENDEFFITAGIVDQTFQLKKELKRKKVALHGGKKTPKSGNYRKSPSIKSEFHLLRSHLIGMGDWGLSWGLNSQPENFRQLNN